MVPNQKQQRKCPPSELPLLWRAFCFLIFTFLIFTFFIFPFFIFSFLIFFLLLFSIENLLP
ncbi:MAG: hypothetical protein EGR08_01420 [Prevotella sp.]|nr:hypothetical protein [Prevotella sp.]